MSDVTHSHGHHGTVGHAHTASLGQWVTVVAAGQPPCHDLGPLGQQARA
jgi:hypothetical protein